MYAICKGMEWNHLPVAGGLYDQHPKFLDDMMFLMAEDSKAQKREQEQREREANNKSGQSKPGRGGKGRGRMR